MLTLKEKEAATVYPVAAFIRQRWSPRSFTPEAMTQQELETIIEAGTWAFSSANEQPWRFITALRGTPEFDQILAALMPGNRGWAASAAALVVGLVRTRFEKEGRPENRWAQHDLGAANATMVMQAFDMGIAAHPMGGFDGTVLQAAFRLDEETLPLTVTAFGRAGSADALPEPLRTRELAPRKRKPLKDVILNYTA